MLEIVWWRGVARDECPLGANVVRRQFDGSLRVRLYLEAGMFRGWELQGYVELERLLSHKPYKRVSYNAIVKSNIFLALILRLILQRFFWVIKYSIK